MREIVLDTETTGLAPAAGDRIVEIACLELVNHLPSGRTWHEYINPERDMPAEAFAIHGLSGEFLAAHPLFAAVAAGFVEFIGDARLVIHNAAFDIGFLNHELARVETLGAAPIAMDRVVDTLALARRKHPFGPNSLDALCRRYNIDNSGRTLHGALLDCELLAEVYLELIGGRQPGLGLAAAVETRDSNGPRAASAPARPAPLPPRLTEAEAAAHGEFVASLGQDALWCNYGVGAPKPETDAN